MRALAGRLAAVAVAVANAHAIAATYHVAPQAKNAADTNAGSEGEPWKTIARAAAAAELKPGDTVLIHAGIYREHVAIKVSGERGRPITFAAAPGGRVVIKGSEAVKGRWTRLSDNPPMPEPYPNAFSGVWKVTLGEEFFTDAFFQGCYNDKSRRWVSQVFVQDDVPLQRIGLDPIYKNDEYLKLTTVGRGLADLIEDSFWFDPADQTLYVKMAGEPGWFCIEVGVRGFTLTAQNVHDVVIRGLEFRHNRQPGGQWAMASVGQCERITVEDCRFYLSDFCGLGIGRCKDSAVRRCDLSFNGNTGLGMGECEDTVVEDCALLFNNYRRFHAGWHCGGMKCIPRNRRCTVQRCEAAYNIACDGIWFDAENADIRILSNVAHHNGGSGIFFEINKGGGIIADNLVYANRGRGIYISGSQNTWVVHNTVAANGSGIVCMPRGDDWPLGNVRVLNNLLLRNYIAGEGHARGCDLTLYMGCPGNTYQRTVASNHSDYNVYAEGAWPPTMRHSWNPDNTLAEWRQRFGEDAHSKQMPIEYERKGTGFRLLTRSGLRVARRLPTELPWRAPSPSRVGSSLTQWP
ncbi:MAG TPA: right-handed parallel beta-helix repeat-containing protein [Planctomycetota bacterium]|nr:right-handed parallel beta-helix repeat-containing protein [Planctomycetota bacterium]HRR82220.1 right-handed parallel beta-helix repeat-containing protein [Planctomycetota bacterium]HRT97126.1 right-handed parallel beta-helix repeat-containing protein [Planctomycetota bacterium]